MPESDHRQPVDASTRARTLRDLAILAVAVLAARGVYMLVVGDFVSADLTTWQTLAQRMDAGNFVYATTDRLNWPPLWMQIIWLLQRIATHLHLPHTVVVRAALALADVALVMLAYGVHRAINPGRRLLLPLLLGLALNPIFIALTAQHGNFDVLVAIAVTCSMGALVVWTRTWRADCWLWACACLGVGILAKTIPFVLIPLLFIGLRRISWSYRGLGALLLFGPVTLGMSVLYVIAPAAIRAHVLGYRSFSGYFGIGGALNALEATGLLQVFQSAFLPCLLVYLAVLTVVLYRRRDTVEPRRILLIAAATLLAIPTVGPGFSVQYIYWYTPLFLLLWHLEPRLRWAIVAMLVLALPSLTVAYGFGGDYGAVIAERTDAAWAWKLNMWFVDKPHQALTFLPMFVGYVVLFVRSIQLCLSAAPDIQTELTADA